MPRKPKSKAAPTAAAASPKVGEAIKIVVENMVFPGPAPFTGELPPPPAVPEVSVVKENPEPEFVDVISKRYQWEPFQHIAIRPGVPTPVRLTSWVRCQLEAKVLRRG